MTCDELREHLSAFLDWELDVRRRRQIEDHLARCAECRADAQALEGVVARVHEATSVLPDVLPTAAILARLPDVAARRASMVERVVRDEIVGGAIGIGLVLGLGLGVGHAMPTFRAAVLLARLLFAMLIGGSSLSAPALLRWSLGGVMLLLSLNALIVFGVRRLWTLHA